MYFEEVYDLDLCFVIFSTSYLLSQEFDEKYPNQMVLFDQEKTTKFMIYFTTDIKNHIVQKIPEINLTKFKY